MGKFILQESEKEQIRQMYGLVKEQEENQEFLDWVKTVVVTPFIAPNPYSNGDLKLGVQINSEDVNNKNHKIVLNLIERLDITTENGKLIHTFKTDEQDGSGASLFNYTTFKPNYKTIDNSYVVYSNLDENSEVIRKIKQNTVPGKMNKFIVTVTPRLSNDILKTGSKIFTTKPNVLVVQ